MPHKDDLKRNFDTIYKYSGLPLNIITPEYRFDKTRKWRFDYAFIDSKVAVEIEGGVFSRGRHTRPMGFIKDCEKYNTAACQGWRLLRFTCVEIQNGTFIHFIKCILGFQSQPVDTMPVITKIVKAWRG